jgi:hypothetical protein
MGLGIYGEGEKGSNKFGKERKKKQQKKNKQKRVEKNYIGNVITSWNKVSKINANIVKAGFSHIRKYFDCSGDVRSERN